MLEEKVRLSGPLFKRLQVFRIFCERLLYRIIHEIGDGPLRLCSL